MWAESFKLEESLRRDEIVLWKSKPLKMPFLAGMIVSIAVGLGFDMLVGYIMQILGFNFGLIPIVVIASVLFVFYIPYLRVKDWRETEYMITNQRVFFDTMLGYAVVDLSDIRDVYVRTGVLDRFFGTGKVFVCYRDFTPVTKSWGGDGEVIIHHKPPSFQSIKETDKVQRILENAAPNLSAQAVEK